MTHRNRSAAAVLAAACLLGAASASAQDWPQWRGAARDAKVDGFVAPKDWPKELTKKWRTPVGLGGATPALVGDKLYVFAREGGDEVIRCLNAADGNEIWKDKYPSQPASGMAGAHPGPRSSPAVGEGKVVSLGVMGVLSCVDAASGKLVWRKDEIKGRPMFFTATSPIIVDGMCIVHLGGRGDGAVIAFDLTSGEQKWKWAGEGPAYGSPVLMTVDGSKQLVTVTERSLVGLGVADGKLLWQTAAGGGGMGGGGRGGPGGGPGGGGPGGAGPGGGPGGGGPGRGGPGGRGGGGMGGGRAYNAVTPVVDGQTVILTGTGAGTRAVKITKTGDTFAAKDAWSNPQVGAQFCTPVLKDGFLYGLSDKATLYCLNATTGATAWTDTGRRSAYGAMVDAGSVVLTLPSNSELTAFKPDDKAYSEVAKIKVADGEVYSYPVMSGKRVFIKDKDSVTMYTIE